jgi:hypothetical protein
MDTVRYKINDNEFGFFIVNIEDNRIINLDKNSQDYLEYKNWIDLGNIPEAWNE